MKRDNRTVKTKPRSIRLNVDDNGVVARVDLGPCTEIPCEGNTGWRRWSIEATLCLCID